MEEKGGFSDKNRIISANGICNSGYKVRNPSTMRIQALSYLCIVKTEIIKKKHEILKTAKT